MTDKKSLKSKWLLFFDKMVHFTLISLIFNLEAFFQNLKFIDCNILPQKQIVYLVPQYSVVVQHSNMYPQNE